MLFTLDIKSISTPSYKAAKFTVFSLMHLYPGISNQALLKLNFSEQNHALCIKRYPQYLYHPFLKVLGFDFDLEHFVRSAVRFVR